MDNFKVICSKDNMMLRKNTSMKLFSLEYQYQNPVCDISALVNINIHNLLYEVNKDIIESIEITPVQDTVNEYHILYIFKEIGGDLGISKKYLFVNTKIGTRYSSTGNTEISFTSKSIPYHYHAHLTNNKYKLLEYPLYIQKFIILSKNHIQMAHMFKLKDSDEDDMTVTMENAIGILIKKMCLRLKVAIEHLTL